MTTRYFDYNATTPLLPEARAALLDGLDVLWVNPSSPYRAAARVRAHLERAREQVAECFAVEPGRVVFNSGATEGNAAIFEFWRRSLSGDAHVGVSPTEHPSVVEAAKRCFGDRVVWLPLDAHGAVDVAAIPWEAVQALSVMAANNETGVFNPWAAIAEEATARGVPYHCDASQWVGKLSLDGLAACRYVTACGHKFGGPRGVGCWILPSAGDAFASFAGGAQEHGHRAGTEDVASILAMAAALQSVQVLRPGDVRGREVLVERLAWAEEVGAGAERLWNTVLLLMPEFASARWILGLEKRGFLVSAGAACATGKAGPSHVLAAMGVDAAAMRRSLRISAGPDLGLADWEALAEAMHELYAELQSDSAGASVIQL